MESKEQVIKHLEAEIGRVYPELKWLNKEEAQLAEEKRAKLLQSLSGRVRYSFLRNKLHTGKLSPGCLICGQGYWSCIFISRLCTANCFYCPQDRKIKKECSPKAEGIAFDSAKDYLRYIEKFGFRGIGFSGGESLLVFEKLLRYIKEIKRRFGNKIYLWIYTNSDLVNKDKLRQLKESGLDEIRFNISARDYDLRGVELAVGIINTVTVEIPCIPEDYEKVKKCLAKMQRIGVDHLNLHQLVTTRHNYKNFIKRNYTFLHQYHTPILESEIFALKIIRYALKHRINLPINYCSRAYKMRLQARGRRQRWASLVRDDFEYLTNSGYIRRFSTRGSPQRTTLRYFEPKLSASPGRDKNYRQIKLPSGKSIFIIKKPVFRWKIPPPVAKRGFYKLFFEGRNERRALRYFFRNYVLDLKTDINGIQKEIKNLKTAEALEYLEQGFPEIY